MITRLRKIALLKNKVMRDVMSIFLLYKNYSACLVGFSNLLAIQFSNFNTFRILKLDYIMLRLFGTKYLVILPKAQQTTVSNRLLHM